MALDRPQSGQCILTFDVAGLQYHDYYTVREYMCVGDSLTLEPEPDNPHDGKAVRVMHDEHIGYIPRAYNRDIFQRLTAGEKLAARVADYRSDGEAPVVRVQVFAQTEEKPAYAKEFGVSGDNPSGEKIFHALKPGTKLRCRSNEARTSVDLLDASGRTLVWFRKSEIPVKLRGLADAGNLFAIVDHRQKGQQRVRLVTLEELNDPGLERALNHTGTGTHTGRTSCTEPQTSNTPKTSNKETTMNIANLVTKAIETNKTAAAQAGYLEAGRIANNQLVKVASKSLPFMARGYADTALGRLLIANAAMVAAGQLRPNDPTLAKLTQAMTVAAYQEVIQSIDIEGMINGLLSSPEIQAAISKLPADDHGTKA